LPRIIKSEFIILKIFWGIAFLCGVAAAFYSLINTLIIYFQYQPVVQVERVEEYPTKFPAVIYFFIISKIIFTDENK
jgi:hypothetical protein